MCPQAAAGSCATVAREPSQGREAAALSGTCGVPQIAGDSGGAAEAVVDGVTGHVMPDPTDDAALAVRIAQLLDDDALRASMGRESRSRAVAGFDYGVLATRLAGVLGAEQ